MIRAVIRRAFALLFTLFIVAVASFGLLRLAPGGPFDQERSIPPEVLAALERHYGLDLPAYWNEDAWRAGEAKRALADTQLGRWLDGLRRGDLGPSFQYRGRSVNEILRAGAAASVSIGLLALELALVGGLLAGAAAASRPGGLCDRLIRGAAALGIACPNYVLAAGLAGVIGLWLRLLPVGGWGRPAHLVLPAVALAVPHMAILARLSRASLLETLHLEFIRTARAKGLAEWRVVLVHALRPSLAPVVQYLGPATASLVTGSLAVEAIFNVPGVGAHFVNAALNRDYTLVMGTVVVYAALVLILNAVADLVALWLDPRTAEARLA